MSKVHPTSIIDAGAVIGKEVEIGPWTLIGADVVIGDNCRIGSHCVISGPTKMGANNNIHSFCVIGGDPQDKKFEPARSSELIIGEGNEIREYCSVNRGTHAGGGITRLGNSNWIMAYCHIAHDCQVGNDIVLANNTTLAGHVIVEDYVTLGGFTGIHQFCHLGEGSFSAISSIIKKDVPPFVTVNGNSAKPRCINKIGLQRRGYSQDVINSLRRCYRILYLQGNSKEVAIKKLDSIADSSVVTQKFRDFITESERGIVR